jgi:hypothetical protein
MESKKGENDILDLFEDYELEELFNFAFPPPNTPNSRPPEGDDNPLLVEFLSACLANAGLSRDDLAQNLATDVRLVDAIFEQTLPSADIENLIGDLAHAIGYEPAILEMLLAYDRRALADLSLTELIEDMVDFAINQSGGSHPGHHLMQSEVAELDALQEQLAFLLVDGLDGYYNAGNADDKRRRILYQNIVKAIQAAIANYQEDIREVQTLITHIKESYKAEVKSLQDVIKQLKAASAVEAMMKDGKVDFERLNIRIVERTDNRSE